MDEDYKRREDEKLEKFLRLSRASHRDRRSYDYATPGACASGYCEVVDDSIPGRSRRMEF
jgi:hypothetical protein